MLSLNCIMWDFYNTDDWWTVFQTTCSSNKKPWFLPCTRPISIRSLNQAYRLQLCRFMMESLRKLTRAAALLVCLLIAGLGCWQVGVGMQEWPATTETQRWRLTNQGWQSADSWATSWAAGPRLVDHVHPTIVAALILLTVMGVCIWASSEWEVDRLLRGKRELDSLERTKTWVRNQNDENENG